MKKKVAIRRLIRRRDGRIDVVYVDAKTGRIVRNLSNYEIAGAGNETDLNLKSDTKQRRTGKKEDESYGDRTGGGGYGNVDLSNAAEVPGFLRGFLEAVGLVKPEMDEKAPFPKAPEANTQTAPVGKVESAPLEEAPGIFPQYEKDQSVFPKLDMEMFSNPEELQKSVLPKLDYEMFTRETTPMADLRAETGPNRPEMPQEEVTNHIRASVQEKLGPGYTVEITSGQESGAKEFVEKRGLGALTPSRQVDQYGSSRHKTGFAADIRIVDPEGRVLDRRNPEDRSRMVEIAADLAGKGFTGVGMYPKSPRMMHLDIVQQKAPNALNPEKQGRIWGFNDEERKVIEGAYNPDYNPLTVNVPKMEFEEVSLKEMGIEPKFGYPADIKMEFEPVSLDQLGIERNVSPQEEMTPTSSVWGKELTPATIYAAGRGRELSPDELNSLSKTLAGEIDLRYTDLNTPEGQEEANNIIASALNRLEGNPAYKTVQDVVRDPRQYSAYNDDKTRYTTEQNYAKNKDMYDRAVTNFLSPDFQGQKEFNPSTTHYFNPSIADPRWGPKMNDVENVGPHRFGALSGEFDNPDGSTFDIEAARDQLTRDMINDQSAESFALSSQIAGSAPTTGAISTGSSPVGDSNNEGDRGTAADPTGGFMGGSSTGSTSSGGSSSISSTGSTSSGGSSSGEAPTTGNAGTGGFVGGTGSGGSSTTTTTPKTSDPMDDPSFYI